MVATLGRSGPDGFEMPAAMNWRACSAVIWSTLPSRTPLSRKIVNRISSSSPTSGTETVQASQERVSWMFAPRPRKRDPSGRRIWFGSSRLGSVVSHCVRPFAVVAFSFAEAELGEPAKVAPVEVADSPFESIEPRSWITLSIGHGRGRRLDQDWKAGLLGTSPAESLQGCKSIAEPWLNPWRI